MNNLDKDIAEVIGEISKVAILINMQGKHTVFINDMGHTKEFSIKLHKNGWEPYADATLSQEIHYCADENDTEEEKLKFQKKSLKTLRIIRDTLYKFFKNEKVSMKNRDYNVEEIKHYKFY